MNIVIVGGGAAGLLAASVISGYGFSPILIERNKFMGVKLNITGKGRCNVTNNCDIDTLVKNTPGNGRFLYSAYSEFTPQDVMEYFEKLGVPLKTERGSRVFPESDRAKDITEALTLSITKNGGKIVNGRVQEILIKNGTVSGVSVGGRVIEADVVILATGGLSYPRTGSDGDGLKIAKLLGHSVTKTSQSLVPLVGDSDMCRRLEGLSLRNVAIKVLQDGKKIFEDFGEMIFTENGVSGPLIISASAHLSKLTSFKCSILIDLKPALDMEMLDRRVLKDFEENMNRDFGNAISKLLPSKLIPVIIERSGIAPNQKVNVISKKQREGFCELLKSFPVDIVSAASYHEAVVTSGGVSTKEISPKTMESKLIGGLYFAGEIIDVDAYTGGFNLQIAWSTAYKAASAACGMIY